MALMYVPNPLRAFHKSQTKCVYLLGKRKMNNIVEHNTTEEQIVYKKSYKSN